jgi:predicted ATPase/DNA-binding SARP family transcriptional activator
MPESLEPEPPALEFRLLGGCDIRVHGSPLPPPRYRKEWWLLALLVLRHDRESSRDALAEAFWPDSDGDRALLYLRRSLTNLRHALGMEAARLLSPTPRTLRFDLSGAFADAVVFDRAVRKISFHSPSEAELAQAVSLYQGPLLPDCADEWVLPEREERAQAYLAALEGLAQRATERGDPATAVHWLRRLVLADPRRESACGALMAALAEGGDRAAVTQVYQDLRRLLRQDFNTDPAPEIKALYQRLTERGALPATAPPPPSFPAPSQRHLPIPLTDLIGRAQEIEEVTGWLRHGRFVTLLGAGGVGKTRLAIAAAEAALPQFAAGVWFVDLAPLSAPSLVPEAVAKALGIGDEAGRSPEERLAEALAASSLLLVLDNCEHVLDACAVLSSHLLSACPHLRVLTTSRQALGVPGEQIYAVPSLRLPPQESLGPEADPAHTEKNVLALLEYEAVRLFIDRAKQTSPAFRLNRHNAEAVVEICHHLDGLPLALELAAARVRSLSPQEIRARLEDRFRLLVAGNRAAAPRHQTLRAAIDWSYGLLSEPERSLLHRLSVFAGGWRWEAAEAVCAVESGEGSIRREEVLDLLTGLTEKSLVSAEMTSAGTDGATRYRLQETVRQYARERLEESGEEQAVRERHRHEFLHLAERAKPEMQGPGQTAWLDRLEEEHDNLRAALDWCLQEPDGAQLGLRLASDLFFLWWIRGYFAEGQRRYAAVLGRTGAGARTAARAKALSRAGGLLSVHGNATAARPLFEEGLAIARELGDRKAEANLLCNLGDVSIEADPSAARAALTQSLAIHREIGNPSGIAHSSMLLGNVALKQERHTEAQALYSESLSLYRALGNPQKTGHSLWCLARCGMGRGDYAQAHVLLEECVVLFRELKDPWGLSAAFALAGEAALQEEKYAQARPLLTEHLRLVTHMGMRRSAPWVLRCFGRLAVVREEWTRAARVFGAADAFQVTEATLSSPEASALAAARAGLGEAAFAAAWSAGGALSLEQAAEDALQEG